MKARAIRAGFFFSASREPKTRTENRELMKRRLLPKRKGELAELRFWTEATRRGMIVSKPYGDSARYDFVVDCGGKLSRVQVKSSGSHRRGSYSVPCHGSNNRPYRRDEIDALVVYLLPARIWYIIPAFEIEGVHAVVLSPRSSESRNRCNKYKERWDLLRIRN